jgi:hypothetical protein
MVMDEETIWIVILLVLIGFAIFVFWASKGDNGDHFPGGGG